RLDADDGNLPACHTFRRRIQPRLLLVEQSAERRMRRPEHERDAFVRNLDAPCLCDDRVVERRLARANLRKQLVLEVRGFAGSRVRRCSGSRVRRFGRPRRCCCRARWDLGFGIWDLGFRRAGRPYAEEGGSFRTCRQQSEEHTSELQSHLNLVCRLLLEKKKEYQLEPASETKTAV